MPLSDFLDGISAPLALSLLPPFVGNDPESKPWKQFYPTPGLFLVPNIKYIEKFSKGELGIAESIKKEFMLKNLKMMGDPEAIEIFLKTSGSKLSGDIKSLTAGGKLKISTDDIQLDSSGDFLGLKALEITTIKSIFESQKPYMEIIEIFVKSVAKIEDIMCRLAAFPAKLSQKPKTNPNALGYKKMKVNKKELKEMRKSATRKFDDTGARKPSNNPTQTNTGGVDNSGVYEEKQILSEVYSTGIKLDGYDYEYEYINIYDDQTVEDDETDPFPDDFEFKPKAIILGYYDESGNALYPPSWVRSSGKWYPGTQIFDYDENVEIQPALPNGDFPRMPADTGNVATAKKNAKKKFRAMIKTKIKSITDKFKTPEDRQAFLESMAEEGESIPSMPEAILKLTKIIMDTLDGDIDESAESKSESSYLKNEVFGLTFDFSNRGTYEQREIDFVVSTTASTTPLQTTINIDPENEYNLRVIEIRSSNSVDRNNLHLLNPQLVSSGSDTAAEIAYNLNPNKYKLLAEPYFDPALYEPVTDSNGENVPQAPLTLYRYSDLNSDGDLVDDVVYYIVEAVLPPDDIEDQNDTLDEKKGNTPPERANPKYYKGMKGALSAVVPLGKLLVDILTKLIPKVKKLMKLLKDPVGFLVGIIQEKAKDGFMIFEDNFINDFTSLFEKPAGLTQSTNSRADLQKARKSIVDNNPRLKNFIYINTDIAKQEYVDKMGDIKFLLDGLASMQLLNFKLGVGTNFSNIFEKKPPIYPDIGKLKNIPKPKLECGVAQYLETNSSGNNIIDLDNGIGLDIGPGGSGIASSSLLPDSLGQNIYEVVTTKYSTGIKLEGYEYDYIYLREEVVDLYNQGIALEEQADGEPDPGTKQDLLNKALAAYLQALKLDPNNHGIREKVDNIKQSGVKTQPIFQFLINLVSFPIKIILQILQKIICIFKGMTLANLPKRLKEFFSFKWLLEMFKPMKVLELLGFKLDIPKFKEWVNTFNEIIKPGFKELAQIKKDLPIAAKAKDEEKVTSLKNRAKELLNQLKQLKFDLSEVIALPIIPPLPGYDYETFQAVLRQPIEFINAILCLIEGVINGFIKFVWSLLNITPVVKPPLLKLCKKLGVKLGPADIVDILKNGGIGDIGDDGGSKKDEEGFGTPTPDGPSDSIIFDIELSDGRNLKDLDREELQKFIDENENLEYVFQFNEDDFGINLGGTDPESQQSPSTPSNSTTTETPTSPDQTPSGGSVDGGTSESDEEDKELEKTATSIFGDQSVHVFENKKTLMYGYRKLLTTKEEMTRTKSSFDKPLISKGIRMIFNSYGFNIMFTNIIDVMKNGGYMFDLRRNIVDGSSYSDVDYIWYSFTDLLNAMFKTSSTYPINNDNLLVEPYGIKNISTYNHISTSTDDLNLKRRISSVMNGNVAMIYDKGQYLLFVPLHVMDKLDKLGRYYKWDANNNKVVQNNDVVVKSDKEELSELKERFKSILGQYYMYPFNRTDSPAYRYRYYVRSKSELQAFNKSLDRGVDKSHLRPNIRDGYRFSFVNIKNIIEEGGYYFNIESNLFESTIKLIKDFIQFDKIEKGSLVGKKLLAADGDFKILFKKQISEAINEKIAIIDDGGKFYLFIPLAVMISIYSVYLDFTYVGDAQ